MTKANRLIHEKSPYLLQHAHNPVDWFPWGEEAFKKALRENKPVFLSIGYAACHWCHVMEKESFEDSAVAALLNQFFISVKVDREERPDIDQIYMKACLFMTGTGGWPLTIFLTPDKKPFFAGTYIPRTSRFGRPGLLELLPHIETLWKKQPKKIAHSADSITSSLQKRFHSMMGSMPGPPVLKKAYHHLAGSFDETKGGFGEAPKFPSPHSLFFLLRFAKRADNNIAVGMVEKTLQSMRLGGIFDQIGGGFHRYSTDKHWLVPHFEKMLYDQALLTMAYTAAFQVTKNPFFKKAARDVINYVLTEMTSSEGAFYSAEDADSEGEEGKYYLWNIQQFRSALKDDPELTRLAESLFSVEEKGNFPDESTGMYTGKNILYLKKPLEDTAHNLNIPLVELENRLDAIKKRLKAARAKRIRPLLDDKILTDWNGLMIAALAKSAAVFEEPSYLKAAVRAVRFFLKKMKTPKGGLHHRFRKNEAGVDAFLDDYAFFIWGLIETYGAGFDDYYLKTAEDITGYLCEHFWDEKNGGFFFTPDSGEKLIFREKPGSDGAYPSGNSAAVMNLLRLGRILSRPEWEDKAARTIEFFSSEIQASPGAFLHMLNAVDFLLGPAREVIVTGHRNSPSARDALRHLHQEYLPRTLVIFLPSGNKESFLVSRLGKTYPCLDGKTTFYVCRDFTCQKPATDIEMLKKQLR